MHFYTVMVKPDMHIPTDDYYNLWRYSFIDQVKPERHIPSDDRYDLLRYSFIDQVKPGSTVNTNI